ncbi:MAG: hypothetical protein JO322_02940 [Candidatus Eremiobacteraeota bacterium]|nr:hypothetical protein [Candidatus Eremiobacteraeota bacterium]
MISARNAERAAAPLREELANLREAVVCESASIYDSWNPPIERRAFRLVARNLAAYIALRRRDLRSLQVALMPFGLSSLGRCESRVLPTLDAVLRTASYVSGEQLGLAPAYPRTAQFFRGDRQLQRNTEELFGARPQRRSTRIMVTLPSEAASDAAFVRSLVEHGMNCARINAAHDSPEMWKAMIANVRAASKSTGNACAVLVDIAGPKMRIERVEFPGTDECVRRGDTIVLAHGVYGPRIPGAARAICGLPEVFPALEPGHRVMIDEGRIGARVERADKNGAVLRIDQARERGEKLRAQKGLNFPDTQLDLDPLTSDDYDTLDEIAQDTDLIGYSFVRDPADVALLQEELRKRRPGALPGIVLKIETARAVANLPSLIVQSARYASTAVMIARGDLAAEIGYRRVAEMQEELLWICEAASVPVVWATQVFDTFVKKGRRSRAEFTDAAMAERADCVMLNKGPYIIEALEQLDDLLGRMEAHQTKKTSRLRALHSW